MMGLDICILPQNSDLDSCHEISRNFCYQITLFYEGNELHTPALQQVFQFLGLDHSIFLKMNVWKIDSQVLYGSDLNLTSGEVERAYEQAFQPKEALYHALKQVDEQLADHPELINTIPFHLESDRRYFDHYAKDLGNYVVDRNFGWDIRTLLKYLEYLPAKTPIRFSFF